MGTGTCSVHSWNDNAEEDEAEPKMGIRVNQKLERDDSYYADAQPRVSRRRTVLRRLQPDDSD
jgi:WD repeat-containing protein 23